MTAKEIKSELYKISDGTKGRHFVFKKKDGSERESWGTLEPSLIPTNKHPHSGKAYNTSPTIVKYFDTEKQDWRSFNADQFIKFLDEPEKQDGLVG